MRDVEAERAIDLELLLREELVSRGLVRKALVAARIVTDVVVLVAGERRLDIDEIADVSPAIIDRADRNVGAV